MKLNVLVTAAGSTVAQGIIKSIKLSSIDHDLITVDATPYAAGLYTGKAGYIVPLARENGFIDAIIDVCKTEDIDVILIGTDYELRKFSVNKERIEKETGAFVMVSPKRIIDIADDKWLTYHFMIENSLPTIPSTLIDGVDDLIERVGFPLVVKPRIGDSSKSTFTVNDHEQLEKALGLAGSVDNPFLKKDSGPIIQQYMGEEKGEFTSTTVNLDGSCRGVLSMNRWMRFGGHTTKAIVKDYPEINMTIKQAAEKLAPLGPCNFQSRIVDNVTFIFEINSRFSGTTPFCAEIGFNTVEASIKHYVLGEEIGDLKYRKGMFLRYFNEIFIPEETLERMEKDGFVKDPDGSYNTVF